MSKVGDTVKVKNTTMYHEERKKFILKERRYYVISKRINNKRIQL